MLVGYARVSTGDQTPQLQVDALQQAGCEWIFMEKALLADPSIAVEGGAFRLKVSFATLYCYVPGGRSSLQD